MRILILTADYESFLKWHYEMHPGLENAPYDAQLASRFGTLFGVADFYSLNFKAMGHVAAEIFVNNIWLQSTWAREHGMHVPAPRPPAAMAPVAANETVMKLKRKLQPFRKALTPIAKKLGYMVSLGAVERNILLAQIESFNPDVVLNQIPEVVTSDILHKITRPGRVLIVQHGNTPPANFDATPYTFGISLIPSVVEFFRAKGLPAENRHLAFDPSVLERLGPLPPKDIDISFVGGLGANHGKRIELLEAIARELPITLYLSSFKGLPKNSPLHGKVRGEVWGTDMYDILRRSKITLNSHIDAAKGMAGNMRLYEATGVGTFLLTDNLPNLPDLFQPGVHVDTYDSPADCIAKIKYYLSHESQREAIAKAGQMHTLSNHTYRQRLEALLGLVEKYQS
jgi:hypothetical protein